METLAADVGWVVYDDGHQGGRQVLRQNIDTRTAAFLSGSLLLLFGLAMAFALGVKAPLDFSVFSAATGAFLLSGLDRYKLSLDDRKNS